MDTVFPKVQGQKLGSRIILCLNASHLLWCHSFSLCHFSFLCYVNLSLLERLKQSKYSGRFNLLAQYLATHNFYVIFSVKDERLNNNVTDQGTTHCIGASTRRSIRDAIFLVDPGQDHMVTRAIGKVWVALRPL